MRDNDFLNSEIGTFEKMSAPVTDYLHKRPFYTGTDLLPDAVSIFIKTQSGEFHARHLESSLSSAAKLAPIVGNYLGIRRVIQATKEIFKKLKAKNFQLKEYSNDFKNLFRGIMEFTPFMGLIIHIFDGFKDIFRDSALKKQFKEQYNIAGIAIDGKVLFTCDLSEIDMGKFDFYNTDKLRFELMTEICLQRIKFARADATFKEVLGSSLTDFLRHSSDDDSTAKTFVFDQNDLATLGLNKGASPDEIRKAYHKLAFKHHPDKGGNGEMFQKIQAAYERLI